MELQAAVFLLCAGGALSGPIMSFSEDSTSCARKCTGSSKFRYESGRVYHFQYTVDTTTTINGAAEDESGLELRATAEIEPISECDMILRLTDVNLMETDPNASGRKRNGDRNGEFKNILERHPLRFSFQDGKIDDLCPEDGETTWSINMKRGLLSTFQNTMDSLDRDQRVQENDIVGECFAEYTVSEYAYSSITIKKTKDILGCTKRNGYESGIRAIPYTSSSKIQSLPLVKSHHECLQKIGTNGRLQEATCSEIHTLRPFSKGENGAITKTNQKLTFKSDQYARRTRPSYIRNRSDMMFEQPDQKQENQLRKEVEDKLTEICFLTKSDVRPEVPRLFSLLVHSMRSMSSSSLMDIYRTLQRGYICRDNVKKITKYFLDAIPMVGTAASVSVIRELISSRDVTGLEADMWITSLAFIPKPTRDMLAEIKLLVDNKADGKTLLAVSSLVNNFCYQNTACSGDKEVEQIIYRLEQNLGYDCSGDFEKVIFSLRALGNAGHAQRSIPTLTRCFTNTKIPMEARVSAVQSFRKISCDADRNDVLALMRDVKEDSELRIAAYLAAIECPSNFVLDQIKDTLKTEEINQVGSFIWSHLTNLMETSDPHRQGIRSILEDEILSKEFDSDKRKFSRNYEGSFFIDKLNLGAKSESNLIWSPKSFIPRSAMLNLTVDVFGHAVNLIEIGGRVEGLEYFLETYFGPGGYFGNNAPPSPGLARNRAIRSDKIESASKKFESIKDELRGSMYLRLFGNELKYASFQGMDTFTSGETFNILTLMQKLAKQQDYSLTQSIILVESTMVIPTAAGFPLRLTVNGTASMDIQVSGKIDMRKFPKSFVIDGAVKPSGAVEISQEMSIDAYVTKAGVKMVSTVHTSTSLKGRVELRDGQIFNMELDTPEDKQEIFDFRNTFFIIHRDAEKEQQMITDNTKYKKVCTGGKLMKMVGMELCGEVKFANASHRSEAPYFPLTGPVSMGLVLHKRDSHSGYVFETKLIKSGRTKIARLALDTPGSRIERAIAADFVLDQDRKVIDMTLISPWKKASFKGSLQNLDNLKQVSGKFIVDETTEHSILGQIKIDRRGDKTTYRPLFEVRTPLLENIKLGGTIDMEKSQSLDIDVSVDGIGKSKAIFRSSVAASGTEKTARASVTIAGRTHSIDARLGYKSSKKGLEYKPRLSVTTPYGEVLFVDGIAEYSPDEKVSVNMKLDKVITSPLTFKAAIEKSERKGKMKYKSNMQIVGPSIKSNFKGSFENKRYKVFATKIDLDYNLDRWAQNDLKFRSKIKNLSTRSLKKIKGDASLTAKNTPDSNFVLNLDLSRSVRHSEAELDLHYGRNPKSQDERLYLSAMLNNEGDARTLKMDGKVKVTFPAKGVNFQAKADHKHDEKELNSNLQIRYVPGKEFRAGALWKKAGLKHTSGFNMYYPGQDVKINNVFDQTSDNEYTNTFNAQINKGQKTTIISTYSRPISGKHIATTDIHLSKNDPIQLSGMINTDPTNFQLSADMKNANRIYSWNSKSQIIDGLIKLDIDLKYPSRRIITELEMLAKRNNYNVKFDVKWDADKDLSRRITLDNTINYINAKTMDGALTFKCPGETIQLKFNHQFYDDLLTHIDIEWGREKKMSVDLNYTNKKNWYSESRSGSIKIKSPYEYMKDIDVQASHIIKSQECSSNVVVSWGPRQKITYTSTISKPVSLKSLTASLIATTPFDGFNRVSLNVDHKIDNGIQSSVKTTWGYEKFDIDITTSNNGRWNTRDLSARVNLLSTIPGLEALTLTASHNDDGSTFKSNISFDKNKDLFVYSVEMTHNIYNWNIQNSGKLEISTPISYYRHLTATWSHRNTGNSIQTTLTSDLFGQKLYLNVGGTHTLNRNKRSITGNAEMKFPGSDMKYELTHDCSASRLKTSTSFTINDERIVIVDASLVRNGLDADGSLLVTTPFLHDIIMKAVTRMNDTPRTGHLEVQWDPNSKITVDSSVVIDGITGDGSLRLTTPFDGFERMLITAKNNKRRGEWVSSASIEYGIRKVISIESRNTFNNKIKTKTIVTTPCPYFRRFEIGVDHVGGWKQFRTNSFINIEPTIGKIETNTAFIYNNDISGSFRLDTPFEKFPYLEIKVDREGRLPKRVASIQIENSPTSILRLDTEYSLTSLDDLSVSLKFTTPFAYYEYAKVSFEHSGDMKKFTSKIEAEYPVGKKSSVSAQFMNGGTVQGSFELRTPLYKIDSIKGSFSHEGHLRNFKSNAQFTYDNFKKIEANANYRFNRDHSGSVTLTTPFPGFENSHISFTHSGQLLNFQSHGELLYGFKKIELDGNFVHDRSTTGTFTFKSPFSGVENMKVSFDRNGPWNSMQTHGEIILGYSKVFETTVKNRIERDLVDSSLFVKLPNLDDINIAVKRNGALFNSKNTLTSSYGKDHRSVFKYTISRQGSNLDFDTTLAVTCRQKYRTASLTVKHNGVISDFSSTATVMYMDKKIEAAAMFKKSDIIEAKFTLDTPCKYLKDVVLIINHSGDRKRFTSSGSLQYAPGLQVNGNVAFLQRGWRQIDTTLKLETPFDGFEMSKISYKHTGNRDGCECYAKITYGRNQNIVGTLRVDKWPMNIHLTFQSPMAGFEDLTATGKYHSLNGKYNGDATFSYGSGNRISLNSELNTATSPISAILRATTPFYGLESVELSGSHKGSMQDFHTTAKFQSSRIPAIASEARLQYQSLYAFDGTIKLTSSIPRLENVKMAARNSYNRGGYFSHAEIGLAPGKTVKIDISSNLREGWSSTDWTGVLAVESPFDILRNGNLKVDHQHTESLITEKIRAAYNGRPVLDLETSLSNKNLYSGSAIIRKPYPMAFSASGGRHGRKCDGRMSLNWDTNSPDRNIQFETTYNDESDRYTLKRDAQFKVIHPSRTMGVRGSVVRGPAVVSSQGELTWNEDAGHVVAYNLNLNDRSRRNRRLLEGNVMVTTPMKTLELTGSYKDNQKTKEVEASIICDRIKKITIKADLERTDNRWKSCMTLILPTMSKELRLGNDFKFNNGRTIFDGRTEFSYSPDDKKALVLSTRLEDISSGYYNKNFSLSFGISHPHTDVDLKINSHLGRSDDRYSSALHISYLTALRRMKTLALRGEIDALRRNFNFEVVAPSNSMKMSGHMDTTAPYSLSLNHVYDQRQVFKTNVIVDPEDRSLEFIMDKDGAAYHVSAKYLNPRAIQIEAYEDDHGRRQTDVLVLLQLNTSRILYTNLHWRPELLREMQESSKRSLHALSSAMYEGVNRLVDTVTQEAASKFTVIRVSAAVELKPFVQQLEFESARLGREISRARRQVKMLYRTNSYYVRDISDALDVAFDRIIRKFEISLHSVMGKYYLCKEELMILVNAFENTKIQELVDAYLNDMSRMIWTYEVEGKRLIDAAVDYIARLMEPYVGIYNQKLHEWQMRFEDVVDRVNHNPKVQFMKNNYYAIISKLPSAKAVLNDQVSAMYNKYSSAIYGARELINIKLDYLMQKDSIRYLHSVGNEAYQQALWAYKYWQVEKNIKDMINGLYDNAVFAIKAEITQLRNDVLNLDKFRVIVYDPKRGNIQFEIYLPVDVTSLKVVPSLSIQKYLNKAKAFGHRYLPSSGYCPWDTYYRYAPTTGLRNMIPPFTAYATVSGDQHFITFDKRHYDFAGRCSYVLTRDLVDGNFTVILNYNDDRSAPSKKSIMIMVDGKSIEIFPNYKVLVNERPVEMPLTFLHTTIRREGPIIHVENGRGLGVICDLVHDVYTVRISGWYFGKVAGLLGTYDNEQQTEFTTSDNEVTTDMVEFVNSWEVGSRCRSHRNYALSRIIDETSPGYSVCQSLFKSSKSPFRKCFYQVSPVDFLTRCVQDLQLTDISMSQTCNISALYARHCGDLGVSLDAPKECTRCEKSPRRDHFYKGDNLRLSLGDIQQSADIVFVVEENPCNVDATRKLHGLVWQIDQVLSRKGITDNRYGIVAYGGPMYKGAQHSHTIDGQLFNSARKFSNGLDGLNMTKPGLIHDAFDAFAKVVEYPFRTGVSKTIVLLMCSGCGEYNSQYARVAGLLTDNDITLHVLTDKGFEISDNRSPSQHTIYGMDDERVYTSKDSIDYKSTGNTELHKQILTPTDVCTTLAHGSSGSVFDVRHLIHGRTRNQKSFQDVLSERISKNAVPSNCQVCNCVSDMNGVGRPVCTKCPKPSPIYKAFSWGKSNPEDDDFRQQMQVYVDHGRKM